MDRNKVIVIFNDINQGESLDLEIPLDLTANELVNALNIAFDLNIDTSDVKNCYLKAENPIALLRGNKTLAQYGIRNGSIISYTK